MWKRDYSDDVGPYGWTVLRWILKKQDVRKWIGFSCFRTGSTEHDNETSSTLKGGKFLNKLSEHQLLKNDASLEIFTALKIQIVVFWVMTPCSDGVGYLNLPKKDSVPWSYLD